MSRPVSLKSKTLKSPAKRKLYKDYKTSHENNDLKSIFVLLQACTLQKNKKSNDPKTLERLGVK